MSFITESFHSKRLKEFNINIKTKYKVEDSILERNTDNSKNDDIIDGIRLEKEYYKDNNLIGKVHNCDPRIHYTFVFKEEENKNITCPNCGRKGLTKEFIDGCPYCHTYYNVDFINKQLGNKDHLDSIMHNEKYKKITLVIDIIISFIIVFLYLYFTSRTFNIFDIFKVLVGTTIVSLILYYVFYMLDALIVLLPIKNYKKKMNLKQQNFFINNNIDKTKFFNNFIYELNKYYYVKEKNVIDYDIIDYLDFNLYENNYCDVKVIVRVVNYQNNKIEEKKEEKIFTLIRNKKEINQLKGGVNIIKCHGCGASIDVNKNACEYCGTDINYLQEWYLKDK